MMVKADSKQDDTATTTQQPSQTNTPNPKEQIKQDDGLTHTKVPGTGAPSTKPKSRTDIESLEKEDPASALDCLIAQIRNAHSPSSSTSHSMPEVVAVEFLQGLKKAAFDQDLFKALEDNASLYHEILTGMKQVQGLRADSDLGKFLSDFEYMLHAAMKGIKQRYTASKSLKSSRAHNNDQLDVAQKFNEETQAIKCNLMEAGNRKKVLDQEI